MKLEDLKGMSREEQSRLIGAQPKVLVSDMVDSPAQMQGKILVFRGNYAGFDTQGLCVRSLKYLEEEKRWKLSDIDLSDMFTEEFDKHFDASELFSSHRGMCFSKAFLLDQ